MMTIGRKGHEFLRNRHKIYKNYANIFATLNYQTAALIARELVDGYLAEEYDEVYLLFNAFKSVMTQDITLEQLLPVTPHTTAEEEHAPEYIYEPSKAALLNELLPKHIEVQMFKAMLESVASEHGARMTAMDSASKNAKRDDRQTDSSVQPRASGRHHHRADGNHLRLRIDQRIILTFIK